MNKSKSWPHGIIAFLVMLFFLVIPDMGQAFYAGIIPIAYFYGREVRDGESALGMTTYKHLKPLVPWFWKNRDNRMDFYYPVLAVGLCSILYIFILK